MHPASASRNAKFTAVLGTTTTVGATSVARELCGQNPADLEKPRTLKRRAARDVSHETLAAAPHDQIGGLASFTVVESHQPRQGRPPKPYTSAALKNSTSSPSAQSASNNDRQTAGCISKV